MASVYTFRRLRKRRDCGVVVVVAVVVVDGTVGGGEGEGEWCAGVDIVCA